MRDYGGDEYDDPDYGDDWLYVEDEYMQADDLAEHAVASPPPLACDEDTLEEWDRFDYFNDIEYDFEGYDDANFVPHNAQSGWPTIGQKRKRCAASAHARKKQRTTGATSKREVDVAWLSNAPIVWRAQADREPKTRPLPKNAEPYAVLADWRHRLRDIPDWVKKPSRTREELRAPPQEDSASTPSGTHAPVEDAEWEDEDAEDVGEEDRREVAIDPDAIMAALQSRLASAGGPLGGMDPQQLLQFALRMANGDGEGDDIAGEMADEMLNQGGEAEEIEQTEAELLSWVAQQRELGTDGSSNLVGEATASTSPGASHAEHRLPPTASYQAQESMIDADENMSDAASNAKDDAHNRGGTLELEQTSHTLELKQTSRKRKADTTTDTEAALPKKRSTRSYATPTAASQAKAAAKPTRSGRMKR